MDHDDRTFISVIYATARAEGLTRSEAAQRVWEALRKNPGYRHLRAPLWDEKIGANTGRRRSYRSPLGEVLGVTREYGHHCADYPRTVRSYRQAEGSANAVLCELDRMIAP